MRQFICPLIIVAAIVGLAGCKENAVPANTAAPTLSDATSAKAAESAKQAVLEKARDKADKSVPLESYQELNSGNQLMYSYLALAGLPVDYRDIARSASVDYARSSDEFQKNDLLKALQPQIDAAIAKAGSQRYFKIVINDPVQKYDFENKGFPVNSSVWENNSYRYFSDNSSYRLSFTNGAGFHYLLNVPEEVARNIEHLRGVYNSMNLVIYCFVQEADPASKMLKAEIVKIAVTDKKGAVLAQQ
ncbi:DUF4852 domain-containing protein [Herbaspirillum autotrophicum]|uniref:DUF4852 domain-containing protein n=1 Tax=Herbaspirillum autotrophicum TaxID=180195 RepID=UPI00067DE5C4|nr:DUF4852 domain-containing protein [Herbaspirillum autotrophicum]